MTFWFGTKYLQQACFKYYLFMNLITLLFMLCGKPSNSSIQIITNTAVVLKRNNFILLYLGTSLKFFIDLENVWIIAAYIGWRGKHLWNVYTYTCWYVAACNETQLIKQLGVIHAQSAGANYIVYRLNVVVPWQHFLCHTLQRNLML